MFPWLFIIFVAISICIFEEVNNSSNLYRPAWQAKPFTTQLVQRPWVGHPLLSVGWLATKVLLGRQILDLDQQVARLGAWILRDQSDYVHGVGLVLGLPGILVHRYPPGSYVYRGKLGTWGHRNFPDLQKLADAEIYQELGGSEATPGHGNWPALQKAGIWGLWESSGSPVSQGLPGSLNLQKPIRPMGPLESAGTGVSWSLMPKTPLGSMGATWGHSSYQQLLKPA